MYGTTNIKFLLRNRVVVVGQQFFVFHETVFTVVDGRCVILTSSAQACYKYHEKTSGYSSFEIWFIYTACLNQVSSVPRNFFRGGGGFNKFS
jgi:hypothetical protein